MAVLRNDPPAQHMRAGFERLGIVDLDGPVHEAQGGQRKPRAIRPHEGEDQRRDRLAEGQREMRRTPHQHRAIGRVSRDQRRVRKCAARQDQQRHQHESRDQAAGD